MPHMFYRIMLKNCIPIHCRPLRDDERLPVRTHRIIPEGASPSGEHEPISDERPRRKHREKAKKKHEKSGRDKKVRRTTESQSLKSKAFLFSIES